MTPPDAPPPTQALVPLSGASVSRESRYQRLYQAWLDGRSPRTVLAYKADLEAFRIYLATARGMPYPTAEAALHALLACDAGTANEVALEYRNFMAVKYAPATTNRRLATLRSYTKLARTFGLITWALSVEDLGAQAYRDTRGPGLTGIKALHAVLDAEAPSPRVLRDRVLLRLLYDLGLRRGEVVALDVHHVDLKSIPPTVSILGKGRASRERITLPPSVATVVIAWLAVHPDPGPDSPLLVSYTRAGPATRRLSDIGLYGVIVALGAKAGIRARPHGLRHAAITRVLQKNGGNVVAAMKFSRHKSPATLMIYNDSLEDLGGQAATSLGEDLAPTKKEETP